MLATISTAARELGCSPDHIRRMIKRGRWPYYRLGKKALRVDPEEIRALGRLIAEGEKKRGKK
ncbi:MAG: helix-turn-helix domain-containing protein [Proteobacteria bacterium]|nr:helix-turn-helix domain-containing protein [Pseudomonadota bacterium]